ncbi:MAG: glycine--tRNA ligase subunit beta [Moraxellaceae bacterium]|jgi:glycyl-tRNA synthetase beta chain|nr:glycine--tRNA ligase subunit beta [Moraxellaceae bacterium]MBP9046003.1 glycine--tRNA ligase subunit beta [Moraxellaceae bacterium]
MSHKDFLVELGTEELPPKALKTLAESFRDGIISGIKAAGLAHGEVKYFAAPRRLAVQIIGLSTQQPDRTISVDGPPVKAAFDANGNPTQAALGFARKNGVDISAIDKSGEKLRFVKEQKGDSATALLPGIVTQSLNDLPIPKRMRWGASRVEFVRPTQWLVILFGDDVLDCEILAQKAGRESRGHRFHANIPVRISSPSSYLEDLRGAWVQADFAERRAIILEKVQALAAKENGKAIIPDSLLNEVTGLVEWPVPLVCSFEERFLAVPQEALISTMQDNQKYFCLLDSNGKLLPRFITVANIESTNPEYIIAGNEKVVRPRLTDAEFFFKQDKKNPLETRNERLKTVVFQAQLGSVYEKAVRVSKLAGTIAAAIGADRALGERAGLLSKCDLATEMVGEFPELQGIAGYYYATHDGEHEDVARALDEQYQPRFAGDALPTGKIGAAVAIADKIDTLVGIFGINQPPSGSKDPFALRRSAIGLLRIIIEKELILDVQALVNGATKLYGDKLANANTANDVFEFLLGRYRAMYEEQGIKPEVILAVQALKPAQPFDFDRRVKAVALFAALPEAEALAAGNKRVANILAKETVAADAAVNPSLLSEAAEKALSEAVEKLTVELAPLFEQREYTTALNRLAALRPQVDDFFTNVMVMADDPAVKANRIALLARLRGLFLQIADISLLQA